MPKRSADRGRDAHRAGTPPHPVPLDVAVGVSVSLDALAVEGDVDEGGSNSRRASIVVKTPLVPSPLSGGSSSNEKRVVSPCGGFADDIQYVHVQTLFGMIFFNGFDCQSAPFGVVAQLFGVDLSDGEIAGIGEEQPAERFAGRDHPVLRQPHAGRLFDGEQIEDLRV